MDLQLLTSLAPLSNELLVRQLLNSSEVDGRWILVVTVPASTPPSDWSMNCCASRCSELTLPALPLQAFNIGTAGTSKILSRIWVSRISLLGLVDGCRLSLHHHKEINSAFLRCWKNASSRRDICHAPSVPRASGGAPRCQQPSPRTPRTALAGSPQSSESSAPQEGRKGTTLHDLIVHHSVGDWIWRAGPSTRSSWCCL